MKMLKVIIIYILIAAISFFVGKYFWVKYDNTIIECDDNICPVPEDYDGSN